MGRTADEPPPPEAPAEEAPEPVFKNVQEFVVYRFIPMYCRPTGGEYRWCAEWWRHSEAVSRFHALWHSWEVLRWEPGTGMSVWYRDHLDPHLAALLSKTGPFRACTPHGHVDPEQLPSVPAPLGWFEDEW
ncbi:uncharacterized protein DUF4913 [Murinocardiopsis flavida]|uniref:Uncharacterized protein DUF4913 n=1 Tax=Murinocardiopsis flavida TaxID=645275 RepID=A0A2P8CGS5_9ACTN|nr:DUF4913 domain-containing protein [Murinocardiopsis flavida]PSK84184.1 uncharacterized protein DUF4913 [Murinocardiopsis flavida]